MKVVVPLSGGADSAALVAWNCLQGREVFPLFIDYGQISRDHELRAARAVTTWQRRKGWGYCHRLERRKLALSGATRSAALGQRVASSATDASFVQGRNVYLITVAATYAVDVGAQQVHVGFHQPYVGGTMPDQTSSFVAAMNRLLKVAFEARRVPFVVAPFIGGSKTPILRVLGAAEFPVDRLWTCYTAAEKACGACSSCTALGMAMAEAGLLKTVGKRVL